LSEQSIAQRPPAAAGRTIKGANGVQAAGVAAREHFEILNCEVRAFLCIINGFNDAILHLTMHDDCLTPASQAEKNNLVYS